MRSYRVYFRTAWGTIGGRDDFMAEDDGTALSIAAMLYDACSDVCETFELWDGIRRVDIAARSGTALTVEQMDEDLEGIVLEHEIALRDTIWAVAQSRRLLERTQQLIAARAHRSADGPP
jgi:hypothetical protein